MNFDRKWLTAIRDAAITTPEYKRILITKHVPPNLHLLSRGIGKRRAAVFIPLCNRNGEASVIFTLRSQHVGTHKGQVSFPGGHIEVEEGAIRAAMRETHEELGMSIGTLHSIGLCQTIPAVTGTLVTPVLGFVERDVGDLGHLEPHEGEVERVFTRSIRQLCDPQYRSYEQLNRSIPSLSASAAAAGGHSRAEGSGGERAAQKVTMPVYGAEEGPERIWGLTAMIMEAVLNNAILPAMPKEREN